MGRLAVRDGPDDADLVEDFRDSGKLLSHIFPGDAFDRAEGPAVLGRGKGLRIPGLVLGKPAWHVNVDD